MSLLTGEQLVLSAVRRLVASNSWLSRVVLALLLLKTNDSLRARHGAARALLPRSQPPARPRRARS